MAEQGAKDSKTVHHRPMVLKKTMDALGIKKKKGSETQGTQGFEEQSQYYHVNDNTEPTVPQNIELKELHAATQETKVHQLQLTINEKGKDTQVIEDQCTTRETEIQRWQLTIDGKEVECERLTKECERNKNEIERLTKTLEDTQNELTKIKGELEICRKETIERNNASMDKIDTLKKEIEVQRQELDKKNSAYERKNGEFHDLQAEVNAIRKEKDEFANDRIQHELLKTECTRLRTKLTGIEKENTGLKEQLNKLTVEEDNLKRSYKADLEEIQKKHQATLADLQNQLEMKRRLLEQQKEIEVRTDGQPSEEQLRRDLENKIADFENEKARFKEDHRRQLEALKAEVEELNRSREEQHEEIARLGDQLQIKTDELSTLSQQYTDPTAVLVQKEEYDKAQQDIATERSHYKSIEAQNIAMKAEIEQFKQLQLRAELSCQGDSFTQADFSRLKQQLQEKKDIIKQLPLAISQTVQVESRDIASQSEPTAGEQDTYEEIDRWALEMAGMADELKKCRKELKRAKNLETTLNAAIQALIEEKNILRKNIFAEEQKNDELLKRYHASEHEKKVKVASNEEKINSLHQKVKEKDLVNRELNERLCTMRIEFQAAQDDLEVKQSKLSLLMQENEALQSIAKINDNKIREIADESDSLKEKITELTRDLSAAKTQVSIYEEELQKTIKEEKKFKSVSVQMEKELRKAGKHTVEEMRRENEEMKERLQTMKEEEIGTHQQLKSYKKSLDDTNEKLRAANEGKQKLQERIDELSGLQEKMSTLQSKMHTMIGDKQSLLEEIGKRKKGQQEMKVRIEEMEKKYDQLEHSYFAVFDNNEKLKNKARVLEQELQDAWAKYDDAIQNRVTPSSQASQPPYDGPHQPYGSQSDHIQYHHHDGVPEDDMNRCVTSNMTLQADRKLKEAEIARRDYEKSRQHHPYRPSELPVVGSRSNRPVSVSQRGNDIEENPIIDNIDEEIQQYADYVRDDTQPPQTQEFNSRADDQDVPYDPNLTCSGCGQRFRVGEIQKLRRHMNEFCIARNAHGRM